MSTSVGNKGIAVVTGASAGLGKIYADRLAQRGFDLLLVARRADRLKALAAELSKKYGIAVETLTADLSNLNEIEDVATHIAVDPRVKMVVNNAGSSILSPSSQVNYAEVQNLIRVNTDALTRLSLAILPHFLERNSGTLINIGSVLSFYSLPVTSIYSGTKAHVMLFTLGLQQEVVGTDVRVQLVLPASTATEIWDVAGIGVQALDPATVMSAEDCVDAALAGLDRGEAVTLPSVEDVGLWKAFDEARSKLFQASQTGNPASRYGLAQ